MVQSKQKCCTDRRICALRFGTGDCIFLRESPKKVVRRIGKRVKLSPRYISPFKIFWTVGDMAYELDFPTDLSAVHPVFYVFMLRHYILDESYIIHSD